MCSGWLYEPTNFPQDLEKELHRHSPGKGWSAAMLLPGERTMKVAVKKNAGSNGKLWKQ